MHPVRQQAQGHHEDAKANKYPPHGDAPYVCVACKRGPWVRRRLDEKLSYVELDEELSYVECGLAHRVSSRTRRLRGIAPYGDTSYVCGEPLCRRKTPHKVT